MKNRFYYFSFFIAVGIVGIWLSYSQVEPVKLAPAEKEWTPKEETASELAQLMRKMEKDAKERKASLAAGELHVAESDYLIALHTATPTEAHMIKDGFTTFADNYIAATVKVNGATTVDEQTELHNALVSSCIACHTVHCSGPIALIEKLYIN